KCPDTPFVFLSGALGEEVAIDALSSGATDYILKQRLSRLVPTVQRALLEAQERVERKRAEEEVRESTRREKIMRSLLDDLQTSKERLEKQAQELNELASIVQSSNDAIVSRTPEGIIVSWNRGAERMYGYTADEMTGKPISILIPAGYEEEALESLETIKQGESIEGYETIRLRKDGREIDVSLTISPIKNASGEVIGASTIGRDITESRQAEQALAQRAEELARINIELDKTRHEQLRLKDEFFSHVSHELRSPLSAIYQFVTLVLDGLAGELTAEQREYLGIALRNVRQLRSMIGDLLDAARAQEAKLIIEPRTVGVTELIEETLSALRPIAKAKRVVLSADVSQDVPSVYADPNRVRQILSNLIDNGIKFTPEHGAVTVTAQVLNDNSEFVRVAVTDTGCGISPDQAQNVFERLYQVPGPAATSRKGLGLGLYICKELVSQHGGRIWVENRRGRGSTFLFTLPRASRNGDNITNHSHLAALAVSAA
ncbi:MAG: PAS domain S-box protein, partial [Verrucomicrobiota bacterium]|nr:PAS domain S-box protein [Verrucomicrobiota bacterium]